MLRLVSKHEWEAAQRRITELERRVNFLYELPAPIPTIHSGYIRGSGGLYCSPRYEVSVSHQDLLLKILAHLGLKLEAIDAIPADVKLVKVPRK